MLSALDLARRIEAGELTPAQVIERAADAIAAHEAEVQAFAALDLDAARRAAREPRAPTGPLRGLPVGFKDIFDTADLPTAYGSSLYAGHRPAADAALVAMTRQAGGIVIGKTVTAAFAHLDPGPTRNPLRLTHTPGGSSSGSAAAVAAGMLAIAAGSQTGGSTIRPASYCGVAAFKPSFHLLPTVGMKCVSWHLDTAGLFAAGVADVAFAAAAITGRDLRIERDPPEAPRIGVLADPPWPAASDDMRGAVETAARASERAGARCTDLVLPPEIGETFKAHATIHAYEAARALAFEAERHCEALGPALLTLIETGQAIPHDAYDTARGITSRARRATFGLFDDIDIVLSPSAPGAAPEGLGSTGSSTFNRVWTLMGVPCVNIPGLADAAGLPLGMQAIGRFGRDRETLRAARFVEAALADAR